MPTLELISANIVTPSALAIIEAAPIPGLGSEPRCSKTRQAIQTLHQAGGKIAALPAGPQAETLALAGLWLLAGELDQSHAISQTLETATGSYWHGIMHRREGDFWNSKYWFRRVGRHIVVDELASQIAAEGANLVAVANQHPQLCHAEGLAETLVDLCQAAQTGKAALSQELQLICWWEWQLLFRYSLAPVPASQ